MKKHIYPLILSVFLITSCATRGPFNVTKIYGDPCPYGERKHPGIDFNIRIGTPIIAISDGKVFYIGEPDSKEFWGGGVFVMISHGEHFNAIYGHLSKILIEKGQLLKRGQMIGLSGASNDGYAHLHFGICKKGGGSSKNYSQTYNPDEFWLGGKPQCFDPNKDYSNYSQKEIILPIACGDYAKALASKTKKKD